MRTSLLTACLARHHQNLLEIWMTRCIVDYPNKVFKEFCRILLFFGPSVPRSIVVTKHNNPGNTIVMIIFDEFLERLRFLPVERCTCVITQFSPMALSPSCG